MEILLLVLGLVTFAFALVSARFDNSLVTPPMIFTAVGATIVAVLTAYLKHRLHAKNQQTNRERANR